MDLNRFVPKHLNLFSIFLIWILPYASPSQAVEFAGIHSFAYQLQEINLDAIARTGFDLVIMDYSSDGSQNGEFSKEQISALQNSPTGRKIVLAYLSIGEAENYRFYWKKEWKPRNPVWIESVNPDWPGNFKVRYWDPAWRIIVKEYLDRILRAGFDGTYLDVVDAYEYFQDKGRTTAADEMIALIDSIRTRAKSSNPDFLIFVQNASELVHTNPDYMNFIDGIGQEDLYFGYEEDGKATLAEITTELEGNLRQFRDGGKLVLTVDYPFSLSEDIPHFDPATRAKIDLAYSRSRAQGFVPYCTVRNLSYLTINPRYEPTAVRNAPGLSALTEFEILSNYPNPFSPGGGSAFGGNSETVISFRVCETASFSIKILDLFGKEITILIQEHINPGIHTCRWNGKEKNGNFMPSGMYWVVLEGDGTRKSRKVLLLK